MLISPLISSIVSIESSGLFWKSGNASEGDLLQMGLLQNWLLSLWAENEDPWDQILSGTCGLRSMGLWMDLAAAQGTDR